MHKPIAVGSVINGRTVLEVTPGRKGRFRVKHACNHITEIGYNRLMDSTPTKTGCRICANKALLGKGTQIGRRLGDFEVIRIAPERVGKRCRWVIRCVKCGTESPVHVGTDALCEGANRRCKVCKEREIQNHTNSQREFTDEEISTIRRGILAGVHSQVNQLTTIVHSNHACDDDEIVQSVWIVLLQKDLNSLTFDEICALANGCGKNHAKRLWNPAVKFVEPRIENVDGETIETSPLDKIPNAPESLYDFAHMEQEDELESMLYGFTEAERALVLADESTLHSEERYQKDFLIHKLTSKHYSCEALTIG